MPALGPGLGSGARRGDAPVPRAPAFQQFPAPPESGLCFCLAIPGGFALGGFARWLLKSELAAGVRGVRKCRFAVAVSV